MSSTKVTPAVVVREGAQGPYFEAKWRQPQQTGQAKQVKRRLGKAWVEPDGQGGWKKRRGTTPADCLDLRTVHIAAAQQVSEYAAEQEKARKANAADEDVTVRGLAREFVEWQRDVKAAKPSFLRDVESMLREPGTKQAGGKAPSPGYLMRAFGDRPAREVTARDVSKWLKGLDNAETPAGKKLSPRTVNKYRSLLHSIYVFGMRADSHELPMNPVTGTDKRREPEPPPLDFYEVEEVEALARAAAQGTHRKARNYKGKAAATSPAETEQHRLEDAQDAELFRVLFYTGMRLGEALALRWSDVVTEADLSGALIRVHRAVSAGTEGTTKGGRSRIVPAPLPAAQAFGRLGAREHFTGDDDYVFCTRRGNRLDDSGLRKRYHHACTVAGLRRIKLHGLRHAAGSIMARSLPLVSVRDALGHAQLSTTNRYLHGKVQPGAVAAMNLAFGVIEQPVESTVIADA